MMMAKISNPELTIRSNITTETSLVRVTCEVQFTNDELEIMNRRSDLIYFQLSCRLLGRDLGRIGVISTEDWIYTYSTTCFPNQSQPAQIEKVTFEAIVSSHLLNEDSLGTDEAYASLDLQGRRTFQGSLVEAKTNLVRC